MPPSASLLQKSVDELDLEIGRALLADDFGSKDASESEVRTTAQRWFKANLDRFRNAVCSSSVVHQQVLEKKTRNDLFAAVVDALLKLGGWGTVPVASLGARLIHYGIDQLCPEHIKPDQ